MEQESKIANKQLLLPDEPINSLGQDQLDRKYFAKHLAEVLLSYDSTSSLVIALYGPWGVGKSSLLKLIDLYMQTISKEGDAPVIVRFNPWNFSSINQLIAMFFRELRWALGQEGESAIEGKISGALETISYLLSPGSLSPVGGQYIGMGSKFLKFISRIVKPKQETLEEIKKKLNQFMDEYGRRVIVFIDDIDRLENENMRLLFRLIRLNGDFNNTTYVLALDRNNTERMLNDIQGDSGRKYLEKIVQVGFDIPPADPVKLGEMFSQQLDKVISPIPQDKWDQDRWQELYLDAIRHFIRTPRDIVMYTNGLYLNMTPLIGEVDPVDFVGLEAIRTFAPDIYEFIRESKELFITQTGVRSGSNTTENVKQLIDEHLSKLDQQLIIPVRQTLRQLFPDIAGIFDNVSYSIGRRGIRICNPEFFERYFYLSISKGEVTEAELRTIVSTASDRDTFLSRLQTLIDDGKIRRFLERFEDYLSELAEDAVPTVINVLIDVGDLLPHHAERMLAIDPQLHIARIVSLLITRIPDKGYRAVIAKELVNSCSGLTTLIRWVASIEPKEKKDSAVTQVDEDELELRDFMELREIVLNRIRSEAKGGTLSQRPNLGMILFRWKDWVDISEPKEYVSELVKTDEGLLDFLVGLMTVVLSTGRRKYTTDRRYNIDQNKVSQFIDLELITDRVKHIKDDNWDELSQEQREAIDAFLNPRNSFSG